MNANDAVKTALITGGSKGIGYGIAQILMKAGIRVAITSRSQQAADEAAAKLNQNTSDMAIGLEADVRNLEALQKAVEVVLLQWDRLDYVIANAGIGTFAPIDEMTSELWSEMIDTNLTGPFNTIKATLPALRETKGYFISIASLAGINFLAGGTAYNASKFGLVGFTQALMLDIRNEGIKATTILPGSVASYFNNHEPGPNDTWKIQPEDIGQIVLDIVRLPERVLPSKIEVRPTRLPAKS